MRTTEDCDLLLNALQFCRRRLKLVDCYAGCKTTVVCCEGEGIELVGSQITKTFYVYLKRSMSKENDIEEPDRMRRAEWIAFRPP